MDQEDVVLLVELIEHELDERHTEIRHTDKASMRDDLRDRGERLKKVRRIMCHDMLA
ncbi:MAG: hypothetical protein JKX85_10780 [Phycisphaeraceae bacterium]|nr:hypothetical protein [Phycisphaeraceae bacterium]